MRGSKKKNQKISEGLFFACGVSGAIFGNSNSLAFLISSHKTVIDKNKQKWIYPRRKKSFKVPSRFEVYLYIQDYLIKLY